MAAAAAEDSTFADANGDTTSPGTDACVGSVVVGTSADPQTSACASRAVTVVVDSVTLGISSAVKTGDLPSSTFTARPMLSPSLSAASCSAGGVLRRLKGGVSASYCETPI